MGIICSTAIELGLTVGKRICNKGIYIFGKVARSELPIMLCLKSWSFLCIYRKLNLEFPVLAYALEMIFQPFVSSILASFYLTLSGFLLPLIVSMSCQSVKLFLYLSSLENKSNLKQLESTGQARDCVYKTETLCSSFFTRIVNGKCIYCLCFSEITYHCFRHLKTHYHLHNFYIALSMRENVLYWPILEIPSHQLRTSLEFF